MEFNAYVPRELCERLQHLAGITEFVGSGAHQMEPASPIQALGVNPFPSRFINRTILWGGFAR